MPSVASVTNLFGGSEVSTSEVIHVESGVSLFNGNPFVVMRWGKESGQLSPEEARTHALWILACANAAESDAVVVTMLRESGLEEEMIGMFLTDMRIRRMPPIQESL